MCQAGLVTAGPMCPWFRVLRAVSQPVLILRSCFNPSICSPPGSDYSARLRDPNLISAALQRPNHICKGGGGPGASPLRAWGCPATPRCPRPRLPVSPLPAGLCPLPGALSYQVRKANHQEEETGEFLEGSQFRSAQRAPYFPQQVTL